MILKQIGFYSTIDMNGGLGKLLENMKTSKQRIQGLDGFKGSLCSKSMIPTGEQKINILMLGVDYKEKQGFCG